MKSPMFAESITFPIIKDMCMIVNTVETLVCPGAANDNLASKLH